MESATPWDGDYVTPMHVTQNPGGGFRMWYQAHSLKIEQERKALGNSQYGNVGEPQPIYTCYAESSDGLNWERPALGVYPDFDGQTNIVFKGFSGSQGNTVVYRPDAPGDERYVMTNGDWLSDRQGGIYLAYSPDGIHWKYPGDDPIIFGESDTWNCLIYNPERQVYMLYLRGWHCAAVNWPDLGKGNARRRVAYSESKDLKSWSEPQIILTPDEWDTHDFYGLQVFRYEDWFLGQLWIFDDDDRDTIEVELIFSRDGIHWSRLAERSRFITTGERGSKEGYMIIPAQEPVVMSDRIWVYYTGHGEPHHEPDRTHSAVYRGTLRLDGFVSLLAGVQPGALISRPFTLESDEITINAATYSGELVAELVEPYYHEPQGQPIDGFSAADFDIFRGDELSHRLSWKGSSDLRSLKGRRLLLRMQLRHAEIYSFTL